MVCYGVRAFRVVISWNICGGGLRIAGEAHVTKFCGETKTRATHHSRSSYDFDLIVLDYGYTDTWASTQLQKNKGAQIPCAIFLEKTRVRR